MGLEQGIDCKDSLLTHTDTDAKADQAHDFHSMKGQR